ncbi:MAG: hypothetical protein FJX71_04595 [Alphaproteobacteria bacterium]|nr:hypothetical protein [Alphaproteobacteria bacterium]
MIQKRIISGMLVALTITAPAWAAKTPQEMAQKQPIMSLPQDQRIIKIPEYISYAYNFEADDRNFVEGLHHIKGKTKRDATVLVNIHSGSPLNISSTYKPGMRTLSWATPYEAALRQAMSALSHAHDQSALLTSWTGNKLRTFVSFVIIPKGIDMEFKIGYASPQASRRDDKSVTESRPGGGMQMRLKYLPAGTIVLTEPLIMTPKAKGKGTYSLKKILETAIQNYNTINPKQKLSEEPALADLAFIDDRGYAESSFDIGAMPASATTPTAVKLATPAAPTAPTPAAPGGQVAAPAA